MTENDIDSPAVETTAPSQGYGAMAGIVIGECQEFLQAVVTAGKQAGTTTISDDFLAKFLTCADSFATQCCQKLAGLLKEESTQSDVRDTPDSVLIRLVRSRAFEVADSSLIEFVFAAKASGINIGNLADSRVREAEQNDSMNLEADESEDRSRPSSAQNAKAETLVQAYHYLNGLDGLAHDFLDYGGGKLFGNRADYTLMNQFAQNVRNSIQPDLADALAYFEGFDAVRKKKWDDLRTAETAAIRSGALHASHSISSRKGGFVSLLLGSLCIMPIWFVFTMRISNLWVLGIVAAFGLLGAILFFRGVFKLMNV